MRATTGILLALVVLLPVAASAQRAHEHEVATLEVSVDGRTLLLRLESPLDNLVGFEHAPRNDKQRVALRGMEARLQAGDRLFKMVPAAGCALRQVTIDHPYRAATGPSDSSRPKGPEGKGGAKKGETVHSELQAAFTFECAKPEHLDRIEVLLFDAFPGLKRLNAQTATPRGQKSASLSTKKRMLPF
jgi:endonuclease YncB( thermonuclease family)